MSGKIRNKAILKAAGIAVFAAVLCVGCYDLGIEPSVPTPTVETFVDRRDGKEYKKVKIGEQVWMAENLNYAADGSVCSYYGCYYDWNTAMNGEHSSNADPSGVMGVCPDGWHLPSDAEWTALIDYVGINSSVKLEAMTFDGQKPGKLNHPDGRDIYGFSALPGGLGSELSTNFFTNIGQSPPYFWDIGRNGYWWSATEGGDGSKAWWYMMSGLEEVSHLLYDKHYMLTVRCVHD